jgi:histidinol dehydrogenase
MRTVQLNKLSVSERNSLLKRPAIDNDKTFSIVKPILNEIKEHGIAKVVEYAKKFDAFELNEIRVSDDEYKDAENNLTLEVKEAIVTAASNIRRFHSKQYPHEYSIDTMNGVNCKRTFRPIENVGLYIPGGTAVLPSTMLMLGIPAQIAGCKRVVACSPTNSKLNDAVLFAAKLAGVNEIYKVGGAQAIGLMAYGTEEIKKVDKIFGPGNQFVTAAKTLVSIDPEGCLVDMPAGPSEVLIIADEHANPAFVAADLLSQAEHGADSQVILVTDSYEFTERVNLELDNQIENLSRNKIATECLKNSLYVLVDNIDEGVKFSNEYAPEHLIININSSDDYLEKITNAGSVFVGPYTPESVGDYASGTNHSLPTYGYAKAIGGVSVDMFMKSITFQKLTKDGLKELSKTVITLAETESLDAHANAVKVRFK